MTGQIVVLVPTRGRPDNALRLRTEGMGLASGYKDGDTSLVFGVDSDDEQRSRYEALLPPDEVYVGPRLRMGPTLNVLAKYWADMPGVDIIGFMGDDHLPRTQGWDDVVRRGFAALRGTGLVYGNDLVHGAGLPTAVFMSADIVRELGFFCPPNQIHLYLDNFWLRLGRDLRRIVYAPELVIEHLHPVVGKAEVDAVYAEVNSGEMYSHDEAAFNAYITGEYPADLERLKKALGL